MMTLLAHARFVGLFGNVLFLGDGDHVGSLPSAFWVTGASGSGPAAQ
jgi:hypothetical protein